MPTSLPLFCRPEDGGRNAATAGRMHSPQRTITPTSGGLIKNGSEDAESRWQAHEVAMASPYRRALRAAIRPPLILPRACRGLYLMRGGVICLELFHIFFEPGSPQRWHRDGKEQSGPSRFNRRLGRRDSAPQDRIMAIAAVAQTIAGKDRRRKQGPWNPCLFSGLYAVLGVFPA